MACLARQHDTISTGLLLAQPWRRPRQDTALHLSYPVAHAWCLLSPGYRRRWTSEAQLNVTSAGLHPARRCCIALPIHRYVRRLHSFVAIATRDSLLAVPAVPVFFPLQEMEDIFGNRTSDGSYNYMRNNMRILYVMYLIDRHFISFTEDGLLFPIIILS